MTLSNGSVQVDHISDLAALEKKKVKFWKGFQFKLKNGKKVEFYPLHNKGDSGPDEAAAAVEKAIRDMASQHNVTLK